VSRLPVSIHHDRPARSGEEGSARWLRLALFSDTYAPQTNGVTRTLQRLVAAVRARGGDARVFTADDPRRSPGPPADDGVRRYPSVPFWAYPELRLAAPPARSVVRELREWGPTLVHAATPFGVGLAGRRAARALRLPLVTSYHTSFSAYATFYRLGALGSLGWSYLRWFHNGGARTYCPSRAVAGELAARGFRGTRLWGRGVDAAHFHPSRRSRETRARLGADDDTVVVAYVGRLAREKGLDVLLHAMPRVLDRAGPGAKVAFAFAGDGPYAAHCRRAAPPGTTFAGMLHGDELSAFYAAADLFVFPSVTDTFGNVLLEAMSSAVPIVAADAAPTLELLGDAGVTFPAGDAAALADCLVSLARAPERRTQLGRAARVRASSRSWGAVFDALIADYADVASSARPAASAVTRAVWRGVGDRRLPVR